MQPSIPPGPDLRVASTHAKADAAFEAVRKRITCPGKGCAACCRGDVVAHPAEVEHLRAYVTAAAWARVRERAALKLLARMRAPCPLLDPETQTCTVYAHRPGVCRIYAVVTPPAWCDAKTAGSRDIANPAVPIVALRDAMDNFLPGGYAAGELLIDQLINRAPREDRA